MKKKKRILLGLLIILVILLSIYLWQRMNNDSLVVHDYCLDKMVTIPTDLAGFRPNAVAKDPETGGSIVADELSVSFKKNVSPQRACEIIHTVNGKAVGGIPELGFWQVRFFPQKNSQELKSIKNKLKTFQEVETVDYNSVGTLDSIN